MKIKHAADLPAPVPDYSSGGNEPEPMGHPATGGGDIPFKQMEDMPKPTVSRDVNHKGYFPD